MTKVEKAAIAALMKDIKQPTVPGIEYEMQDGGLKETGRRISGAEVNRLFASADFKFGWELCQKRATDFLQFILTGKPKELARYARQSSR